MGHRREHTINEKAYSPKPRKFPAAKQRRLDQLLEKNSNGNITPHQTAILQQLVAEAEALMVANAKRLAEFSKGEAIRSPAGAVPVTVWIQPHAQHLDP
jgi:hypothetical protein